MLIITADDFGKNRYATDSILRCFLCKSITSASAMVFMKDSVRAASLSTGADLEIGLHLNFTSPFNAPYTPPILLEHQGRIITYLNSSTFSEVIYNPFISSSFTFVFLAQLKEFIRLYDMSPVFFNGHHHMHLCVNMMISNLFPTGSKVRKSFTFGAGDKNILNRLYRQMLNLYISKRYLSTDYFFDIVSIRKYDRLKKVASLAVNKKVEIEVHPENKDEFNFILSGEFHDIIKGIEIGGFLCLR